MAKEGQDNNWNRPKRLNPKPGSLQGGRLDGLAPVGATNRPGSKPIGESREPMRLMEEDLGTNPADLALTSRAPNKTDFYNEEDNEADQVDRLNAEANRQTEVKQQTDQERQQAEVQRAEAEARARETERNKGQVRESDPLNRQENPQTEANRTPAERTPTEFGKSRTEPKPGDELGSEARTGAQGAGRVAQTTEKAAQLGGKAVRTGEKIIEKGAEALKAASKVVGFLAKAGAFIAANWGVILAVLVVVGIVGALFFGISALVDDEGRSGVNGGTFSQAASLNDPAISKAIANLSLLAGDEHAIEKNVQEQTEKINGYLIEIEKRVNANEAAKRQVGEAVAEAKTITEKIMSSGAKDHAADLTRLFKVLDKILIATYGIKVTEPAQIATKAREIYDNRASWVGSKNDQKTKTDVLMRDGRNAIDGKRGCDLSGFVVYILRPTVTDCLLCATPNIADLENIYRFVLAPTAVDNNTPLTDLQSGDITFTKKGSNAGVEVAADNDGDKKVDTVYYCSAKDGPKSDPASTFFGGDRTLTKVLRLKNNKPGQP